MRKIRNIALLFMSLVATSVFAGDNIPWTPIDKGTMSTDLLLLNRHYQKMSLYEVTMTDFSYENYTTGVYHEKSTGYYKKNKDKFHLFILGIHTIQNNLCKVVVDTAKKIVVVADPANTPENNITVPEFETLLKICTKLQKAVTGKYIYYHMEFQKEYRYTSCDLTLKDSLPEKVVMYFNKKTKQDGKSVEPRMEINYGKWEMEVPDKVTAFNIDKYVFKKGEDYVLTPAYAGKFKLLDQRVLSKINKK